VVPSLPFNRLADAVSADALAATVRAMLKEHQSAELSRQTLRSAVEEKYAWHHHDVRFISAVEALRR